MRLNFLLLLSVTSFRVRLAALAFVLAVFAVVVAAFEFTERCSER